MNKGLTVIEDELNSIKEALASMKLEYGCP